MVLSSVVAFFSQINEREDIRLDGTKLFGLGESFKGFRVFKGLGFKVFLDFRKRMPALEQSILQQHKSIPSRYA